MAASSLLVHGRRVHPRAHGGQLGADQVAHGGQDLERLERLLLVDPRDREPNVDDHVVAELHVGDVGEADVLADAAEVDLAHRQACVVADLDDPTGDPKAHGCYFPPGERPAGTPGAAADRAAIVAAAIAA
jgi:hypothetical protein